MRTTVLILLLYNTIFCVAQNEIPWGWDIQFEDTAENKFVLIDTSEIWVIAHPQKQILFIPANSPHLGSRAIFTDSSGYYPKNVRSAFQIRLLLSYQEYTYWMTFEHKYDFEYGKDGGIIETSYDDGITWQNILEDTLIQNNIYRMENLYSGSDTISAYNRQPGFTGLNQNMKNVVIEFYTKAWMANTSLLIRFLIASDSNDYSNEGWLIDDINFGCMRVGVNQNTSDLDVVTFPNPTKDFLNIQSQTGLKNIALANSRGEFIREYSPNLNRLDVSDLPSGIYFLVFTGKSNEKWFSKFVKL